MPTRVIRKYTEEELDSFDRDLAEQSGANARANSEPGLLSSAASGIGNIFNRLKDSLRNALGLGGAEAGAAEESTLSGSPAPVATPQPTLSPTPQPQQGGFRLSVPGDDGDVKLPDTLAQGIGNEFEDIQQATSSGRVLNHPYGRQKKGYGRGENAGFITGKGWDDYNYDNDGNVKYITNPFTKEKEKNEDRGLFRINNETFYTYLQDRRPGYREAMYKAGIIDSPDYENITPEKAKKYYERMYDSDLNTKMARIIYDKQGWDAWFAAPEDLVKTLID